MELTAFFPFYKDGLLQPVVVPADAFVFRSQGPQVVTVTNEKCIHWQNIHVGRDFGTQLEVLDDLSENTEVVINPNDDLVEGIQVQVKPVGKPTSAVVKK